MHTIYGRLKNWLQNKRRARNNVPSFSSDEQIGGVVLWARVRHGRKCRRSMIEAQHRMLRSIIRAK